MRLILASRSPRRRELLDEAGYQYEIIAPSETAECGICSRETPPELVARLAYQKAADVAPRIAGQAMLIACDTVAECAGRILGKPEDRRHADEMLRLLSGSRHSVYSGLCLWHVPSARRWVQVARSELVMDRLSEQQIAEYVDSEQWCGKAGAFGYQDGHPWLKLVSGTASNVVGLPMDLLAEMLRDFDLHATR